MSLPGTTWHHSGKEENTVTVRVKEWVSKGSLCKVI